MAGVNHVAIEVIRPSDRKTGKELVVDRRVFTKNWIAPEIAFTKRGPDLATTGEAIPYQISMANVGTHPTAGLLVRDVIPPGVQFVSANPPPSETLNVPGGTELRWRMGAMTPGENRVIELVLRAVLPANENERVLNKRRGIADRRRLGSSSSIRDPHCSAGPRCPQDGTRICRAEQAGHFHHRGYNDGAAVARNVQLQDDYDAKFVSDAGEQRSLVVGDLQPGERKAFNITLRPVQPGTLVNRVIAVADGGLRQEHSCTVNVAQPQLTVSKSGPQRAFIGGEMEFMIEVKNTGSITIPNVQLRDQIPAQLRPLQYDAGGRLEGSIIFWALGDMRPGEKRVVRVRAQAMEPGLANNVATAFSDGVDATNGWQVEIAGVPGLTTELLDTGDAQDIGQIITYNMRVHNTGSQVHREVTTTCTLPEGMEFLGASPEDPNIVSKQDGNKVVSGSVR